MNSPLHSTRFNENDLQLMGLIVVAVAAGGAVFLLELLVALIRGTDDAYLVVQALIPPLVCFLFAWKIVSEGGRVCTAVAEALKPYTLTVVCTSLVIGTIYGVHPLVKLTSIPVAEPEVIDYVRLVLRLLAVIVMFTCLVMIAVKAFRRLLSSK